MRDLQDFFYVCPIHLKDRGFCSPIIDEEEIAAKKRKEEMDKEIEKVKQEYEEKMKRKKQKSKDAKNGDDKRDKKKDAGEGEDEKAEKEKDDKVSSCHAFLVLLFHKGNSVLERRASCLWECCVRIFTEWRRSNLSRIARPRHAQAKGPVYSHSTSMLFHSEPSTFFLFFSFTPCSNN